MIILYFVIAIYILTCFSLSKLFPKAGVESSKAWIPGVNFIEWCKLIGKKPIEALWLLFPVVNIFTFTAMAVDLVRSFGKNSFLDSAAAVLFAPGIFYKIATDDTAKYQGPVLTQEEEFKSQVEEATKLKDTLKLKELEKKNPYKKPVLREWTESIVFAVFAAAFIRMFLIEAFVIPTSSMEGSLNVGDYLFVSKAHYGMRTPMTIAMVPLAHNTLPILGTESYLKKPSLGYFRFPAIENIEKGKPIVFNWPVGDSVYLTPSRSYFVHQVSQAMSNDPYLAKAVSDKDLRVRPVDKKDHYIKRCVATPGDTLMIKNRQIFINGVAQKNPTNVQYQYYVSSKSGGYNQKKLSAMGISPEDNMQIEILTLDSIQKEALLAAAPGLILVDINPSSNVAASSNYRMIIKDNVILDKVKQAVNSQNLRDKFSGGMIMVLNEGQKEKLAAMDNTITFSIVDNDSADDHFFPFNSAKYPWSMDNYGPIWIPKKGATVTLTNDNIAIYRKIIDTYERNTFTMSNGQFIINGKATTSYTFKQDYFWAMGDNRHMSEDSRMWGFVPEDHIVGKPLFIWFSTLEGEMRKGINWNRIFKSASIN